jgi:16S rRNA (uracil1498-N3)-methyltransferase
MKKIHRFFIDEDKIKKTDNLIKILDQHIVKQINLILKLTENEEVCLLKKDTSLEEIYLKLVKISSGEVVGEVLKISKNENEPVKKVHLFQAILKNDNFEDLVKKTTEIGVFEITPIITERTIKKDLKIERIETILKESAEQSHRGLIPKLNNIKNFKETISYLKNLKMPIFVADPWEVGQKIDFNFDECVILIGPEGGFSEKELQEIRSVNGISLNLGKTILRGETAAVVGVFRLLGGLL